MKKYDEKGREIVDVYSKTSEVNEEGTIHLKDGRYLRINEAVLTSPLGKKLRVVMMFNSSMVSEGERINFCPSCKVPIPLDRPILLMEDGDYVLPCLKCEWVWFWVDSSPMRTFVSFDNIGREDGVE